MQKLFKAAPLLLALAATPLICATEALAAGKATASALTRNVNQQDSIESGLQSGQLSTGEAAQLEKGEARIDKTEAKDAQNGSLSAAERAQISKQQNNEAAAIKRDETNTARGNPASASSQRLEADVAAQAAQQSRIQAGAASGAITNRDAGELEAGQGHLARADYNAGSDLSVNAAEQAKIQASLNRQNTSITDKLNGSTTTSSTAAGTTTTGTTQ